MIQFNPSRSLKRVLCLGAHPDDIEIGCGGTLLHWRERDPSLEIHWVVCSAPGERAAEAEHSAREFLGEDGAKRLTLLNFEERYFPSQWQALKERLAQVGSEISPDLVFSHRAEDAHQDHRCVGEIARTLFRDHTILEYEIPKWDGDFARPNLYQGLLPAIVTKKIAILEDVFPSQRDKHWFDGETFRGLLRLRGVECNTRYAEAFSVAKVNMELLPEAPL